MPKHPIHLLLLLLTLILGSVAPAWAGTGSQEAGRLTGENSRSSLYLFISKPFEKVGLVEVCQPLCSQLSYDNRWVIYKAGAANRDEFSTMAMCDMDTGAVLGNNALQIDVLDSNNPFSYTSSGESLPFGFAGRFRDISGLHFNRGLGPRPINLGLGSANNVPTYVAVGVGVFVIAGAILAPEVVIPLLLSQPVVWGGVAYSAYAIGKQVYDVHNGDQDRIHYGTMALDAVGLIPLAGVVAKSVRAGWMGTRATGAGNNIFAGAQLHEYAPNGILIAQTCEDSCVRASSKMLLSDFGKNVPDYEIRAIIQEVSGGSLPMRDRGAFLNKVVELFEYAGVTNAQYQRTISFDDIYRMTQTNSIIAQVKGHAIVVDGVSGKLIKIRDPWSLTGTGQSYMIHADDFFSHGNVKAISFGGKQ